MVPMSLGICGRSRITPCQHFQILRSLVQHHIACGNVFTFCFSSALYQLCQRTISVGAISQILTLVKTKDFSRLPKHAGSLSEFMEKKRACTEQEIVLQIFWTFLKIAFRLTLICFFSRSQRHHTYSHTTHRLCLLTNLLKVSKI